MNEIVPFSITADTDQKPLSHSLTYTNQDYNSLKSRMIEIIEQKFSKDFTDFSESSLAMMLIELWAFLADQLSFKIDQVANELFIDTVTETANIMRLANLVGFKPTPPLAAKAMFSINLNHAITNDFAIDTPLEVTFQAASGQGERHMELFQADEYNNPIYDKPIVVPAGAMFVTNVVGIEGKTNYKQLEGLGTPWQQVILSVNNVLWGSISVTVNGEQWREVDFFTGWQPLPEYRIEWLEGYKAVIVFGDNSTGLVPPKNSTIRVTYRVGGGESGNIVTGAINRGIPLHVAGLGHMITCQISNYTKGEGGYSGDQIEDIRAKLPLYMKNQGRAVTGSDYKSICEGFASPANGLIGKAAVALRNQGCAGNIVDIYVLAKDGTIGLTKVSDNLKKELSAELLKKKMFSDYICLRDGEVVLVDINVSITIAEINKRNEAAIRDKVNRRLANLFSLRHFEFGQSLKEADIIKAVADIQEIDHVYAAFTTVRSIEEGHGSISVVSVGFKEIIRPDNVVVTFQYK